MKKKATRPYTRRTPSEWSQIVKAYTESGLSEREFCSERRICLHSFRNWREKLLHQRSSKFVTIDVVDSPSLNCHAELVLPSGIVVRMGESIALSCIRDLLSVGKEV